MRCTKVKNLIPELVADEIAPRIEARMLGHLSACRECSCELEAYRVAAGELRAAKDAPAAAAFAPFTWADIRPSTGLQDRAPDYSPGVLFAAACSAVALALAIVLPTLSVLNSPPAAPARATVVATLETEPVTVPGQVPSFWEADPASQLLLYPNLAGTIAPAESETSHPEAYGVTIRPSDGLRLANSDFHIMPVLAVAADYRRHDF